MVGTLRSGPRDLQQFCAIDRDARVTTYSRPCTVEQGEFILVRVPWGENGKPDLKRLSAPDRRFVAENVTPAEHKARGNGASD